MKHPGSHNARQSIDKKRLQQFRLVESNFLPIYEYPIRQDACKHQKEKIKQKNAPVWQAFLTKIPIQQFINRIHKLLTNALLWQLSPFKEASKLFKILFYITCL
jgi:hypothetical protein